MTITTGTKLGRYEIRSKIGEGGMGEVYLAQDTTELERTVAVKVLPAGVASDPKRMQRFIQEAKTVSALNHPNILTIHEFGQEGVTRFIATEFVDGVTLREYLTGSARPVRDGSSIGARRMRLHDVLDVAIQIAAALDAAHEAKVVHRDIKPDNIMVRSRDAIVKVLDFGLAKPTAKADLAEIDTEAGTRVMHTEPGVVMGTVSYMSPEQSAGSAQVDYRTDIWSLGVVLYEMVAGRVPFAGKDVHRQIIALQENDPEPLSRSAEGVPPRLEEIVAKALAKDPNERYQTAKDLLIDLRNLKRKLEVDAEIERTVSPELRGAGSTSTGQSQSATVAEAAATASGAIAASSAEYIVSGLKQHKLAAAIGVIVVALGAVALAFYLHARNTEVAIDSIAVLPFVNQSKDPSTEYLSDGLTEGIINSLTQVPNLRVVPRNSVFRYKGKEADPTTAGHELGVRAVLTGRVLQRGDSLLVSAELVDARDNKQLWGEQYERSMSEMLAIKQEIAREITEKLRLRLTGEEQKQLVRRDTTNREAYQLYLKGRYYWNRRTAENVNKAVELFQQAIDKDPNYALAYVGLADCYLIMEEYVGTPSNEVLPKAKAAIQKALQLDDSVAEAHASQAMVHWQSWQFPESEAEFRRAIKLNPTYPTTHHWFSLLLRSMGRSEEAEAEIKRAYELDPLSPIINANLTHFAIARGDAESAITQCKKLIDLYPNYPGGYLYLGWAYQVKGDFTNAISALEKSAALSGRQSFILGPLGQCYALGGRRAEAQVVLKELEDKYARHQSLATSVAAVYAGLGDRDQAFAWLEKGFQTRSGEMVRIVFDPPYDLLRSDPRYTDLVRRMELKQ